MKNKSAEVSWVDRAVKRFRDVGFVMPEGQRKLYRAISDHFMPGKVGVDIGIGVGEGSNILSWNARYVWGVDINEESVDFANQMFKRPNLQFDLYDIENPPTREVSRFEIVVMSEIIEHLENPDVALNNMKRFFSPKHRTIGFITCPNIANEDVRVRDANNPLHLQHWDAGSFYALMTSHFHTVTLYSVDKLDIWDFSETIDGTSTDGLIVAKVEDPIYV